MDHSLEKADEWEGGVFAGHWQVGDLRGSLSPFVASVVF